MINYMKNFLENNNVKKMITMIDEIEQLIFESNYDRAKNKFNKLLDYLDNKFEQARTHKVLLLDIYLHFIFNYHNDVLTKSNEFIKYIEDSENISEELKKYYKAFIYNIELVSSLVEKKIDRANIARENFIKNADFTIYLCATKEELEELENFFPIVNTKGENMLYSVIFNEYSQDIDEGQRKYIQDFIWELMKIINENKRKTIYC